MFSGKTILITGASGGIGAELVKALLHENANIIAIDSNSDSLSKLKERRFRKTVNFAVSFLKLKMRKAHILFLMV